VGEALGTAYLLDFIAPGPVGPAPATVLQFDATGNPLNLHWSLSQCTDPPCGGGFAGTYRIEERRASAVPPATGWLLAGAMSALALRRRAR
jgi:hypothetical protein